MQGMAIGFILSILFCLLNTGTLFSQTFMIVSPKDSAVSDLHSQAVTAQGPANANAELWMNGSLVTKDKIRVDGVIDFLNVQVPSGNVTFEVRVMNADGSLLGSQKRMIHILGAPATVKIAVDNDRVFADEKATTKGTIRVLDQWGYAIQNGIVSVGSDSGMITSADVDPTRRGTQVQLVNGVAEFEYKSGPNAGVAVISAKSDVVEGHKELNLDTPKEPFNLIGLVEGTGVASSRTSNSAAAVNQLASEDAFPDKFNTDERAAVYARGTVASDYLLTLSYDSDRRNRSRLFREIDPDYLYSIYGDNSMLYYDAQTNYNLFAKLERNQSYVMVGDYNTDLTKQEFTLYNRSLNGVKAGHQDKDWKLSGFASLTDKGQVQQQLRGTGLSGFYYLGNTNITYGSEKIRLETRDKFHSERVMKHRDMYRFTDYEIDYQQGTVFFKQPVPAIDENANPVYIVVDYEQVSSTSRNYIGGGRVERKVGDNLTVGVTGIGEEQSPTSYTLFGGDARYQIGNDFSVSGEVGSSNNVAGTGLAYKVETTVSPITDLSLNGYYRKIEKGFFNITQSNRPQELGTMKYGVGGTYSPSVSTKFNADYYQNQQDVTTGTTKLNSVSGGIEHKFDESFSGTLRMEDVTYDGEADTIAHKNVNAHSALATARLNYDVNQKITVSAERELNIGTDKDLTRPDATSLMGEYKITPDISVLGQEKIYQLKGNLSTIGLNTTPMEGTTLYGKYEIGNAIGERRNMVSIGIRNQLKVTDDVTANFGYERAKSLERRIGQVSTQDHSAYTASLEYLPKEPPLKLIGKGEYGANNIARTTNLNFAGDYRINNDLSAITKFLYSHETAVTSLAYRTQQHLIMGLAYRPVTSNNFNSLAKAELKRDANFYLNPFDNYGAFIVSDHSYIEPIKKLEIGVKYAAKFADERTSTFFVMTHTYFYLLHAEYDITDKFDVGAEYRLLAQSEARNILNGFSAEVGYVFVKNLRLAAGYNFKGFKDRDLVDYTLWTSGPFVKFEFKFDEELLGLQ